MYNNETALLMSEVCKLSYSDNKNDILTKLREISPGTIDVKLISYRGSQAIIVEHLSHNTVAFRGSDELSDWFHNINSFSTTFARYRVHDGFTNAFVAISSKIFDSIIRLERKPLFITGHSLGGAMAVLCAAWFENVRGLKFHSIYTFGQPRVFKAGSHIKFSSKVRGRYFRFENNNDVVVHVPPSFWFYKHTGKLIYIDKNGKLRNKIGFFSSLWDHFMGLVEAVPEKGLDIFKDHDINKYIKALNHK